MKVITIGTDFVVASAPMNSATALVMAAMVGVLLLFVRAFPRGTLHWSEKRIKVVLKKRWLENGS